MDKMKLLCCKTVARGYFPVCVGGTIAEPQMIGWENAPQYFWEAGHCRIQYDFRNTLQIQISEILKTTCFIASPGNRKKWVWRNVQEWNDLIHFTGCWPNVPHMLGTRDTYNRSNDAWQVPMRSQMTRWPQEWKSAQCARLSWDLVWACPLCSPPQINHFHSACRSSSPLQKTLPELRDLFLLSNLWHSETRIPKHFKNKVSLGD